jgi:hypothetical protein
MDAKEIAPVADASGDKLDAILKAINGLAVRVDEMEKNMPAEPLMKAADKKRKDDDDMKMDDDEARKDDDDMKAKKDSKHRKDDDDEEVPRMDKKRKDDDDTKADDSVSRADKKRDDAHGVAEKPSGEMRFDEEEAKMDDDDEEAMKKDDDDAKKADTQAKCDAVFSAFGKSASRPLEGESHTAYRKRLLRGLQSYSDEYKEVNLLAIKDAKLLDIAERRIMADALASAKMATHIPKGSLFETKRVDASGRTITSYQGHIGAFLDQFKLEPMRATKWFTNNVERN